MTFFNTVCIIYVGGFMNYQIVLDEILNKIDVEKYKPNKSEKRYVIVDSSTPAGDETRTLSARANPDSPNEFLFEYKFENSNVDEVKIRIVMGLDKYVIDAVW